MIPGLAAVGFAKAAYPGITSQQNGLPCKGYIKDRRSYLSAIRVSPRFSLGFDGQLCFPILEALHYVGFITKGDIECFPLPDSTSSVWRRTFRGRWRRRVC